MAKGNFLVISDLQIPFEAENALRFCKSVQKEFYIPAENILCVGDEVDEYFGSLYNKDPDAYHTPTSEIRISRDKLKLWYRAFPTMRLAISNHGMRWAKKASQAEIPSQMLRSYQELLEAPAGWKWAPEWVIKTKYPFRMIHGLGYSGQNGHRTAAMDGGISTVIGHLHSHAGIAYINTSGQKIWGCNAGCLIDTAAYAFSYGRDSRFKPWLGCAIITDEGHAPHLIPYEAV